MGRRSEHLSLPRCHGRLRRAKTRDRRPAYDYQSNSNRRGLSPSSRYRDQVNKFNLYKTLPSFREYVLINQNQPRVEVYYKNPKTQIWSKTIAEGLQSKINLRSLNIAISLHALYQRISF